MKNEELIAGLKGARESLNKNNVLWVTISMIVIALEAFVYSNTTPDELWHLIAAIVLLVQVSLLATQLLKAALVRAIDAFLKEVEAKK